MSDRIAQIVVLCEDARHFSFVNAYLSNWRIPAVEVVRRSNPAGGGSAEQFVRDNFRHEVTNFRGAVTGRRRRAVLIVVIDADGSSLADEERALAASLRDNGVPAVSDQEAVVLLIPKWSIETWIEYLNGRPHVDEYTQYKRGAPPDRRIVHKAARELFELVHGPTPSDSGPLPALNEAIRRLRSFHRIVEGLSNARR